MADETDYCAAHAGAPGHQVDDRMALATSMINDQLRAVQLGPLTPAELLVLSDRHSYRALLVFLATTAPADLSEPQAMLDQWHAWNTRE